MFYNLLVSIYIGVAWLTALFNKKARAFVSGRKGLFQRLTESFKNNSAPVIWFHCASLGEFEQGRPIIESIKPLLPNYKLLLTFFSPSGFEVRKNYSQADYIFYLPYDVPSHVKKFVSIAKPTLAVFIKYEFWPNLLRELEKQKVPVVSASSIFRANQIFFQWYGGKQRQTLRTIHHFFLQNESSLQLLRSIGIQNVTLSGDTRFDRVIQINKNRTENIIAKKFKNSQPCMVVGSCWPDDFEVLIHFINNYIGKLKFIIAPHEIDESFILQMMQSIEGKSIRYSKTQDLIEEFDILIIDNIGMLSSLYQYGEYAYVGGAFGKGLHNILEASCYGIPVFFGNKNYQKFNEANELIAHGGAYAVSDFNDLKSNFEFLSDFEHYQVACNASRNYVEMNVGATEKIVKYCMKVLNSKSGTHNPLLHEG